MLFTYFLRNQNREGGGGGGIDHLNSTVLANNLFLNLHKGPNHGEHFTRHRLRAEIPPALPPRVVSPQRDVYATLVQKMLDPRCGLLVVPADELVSRMAPQQAVLGPEAGRVLCVVQDVQGQVRFVRHHQQHYVMVFCVMKGKMKFKGKYYQFVFISFELMEKEEKQLQKGEKYLEEEE